MDEKQEQLHTQRNTFKENIKTTSKKKVFGKKNWGKKLMEKEINARMRNKKNRYYVW